MSQRNSNYAKIQSFGQNSTENNSNTNPLVFSLNNTISQRFEEGNDIGFLTGQHSKNAQSYISEYCSQGWDGFCELASKNNSISWPNTIGQCNIGGGVACQGLTAGEILIQNTAAKKYLVEAANCKQKFEPFDPTVADSPFISTWENDLYSGGPCIFIYDVDAKTIDKDVVMDKILSKPNIALDILINIYNTRTRNNTLQQLNGTKLGNFYKDNMNYFKNKIYLKG